MRICILLQVKLTTLPGAQILVLRDYRHFNAVKSTQGRFSFRE
jgi:hypothetical protein